MERIAMAKGIFGLNSIQYNARYIHLHVKESAYPSDQLSSVGYCIQTLRSVNLRQWLVWLSE